MHISNCIYLYRYDYTNTLSASSTSIRNSNLYVKPGVKQKKAEIHIIGERRNKIMDCLCKADLPYVEVEKSVKSPFEVRLLMPVYGGKGSETTAIMGYIFQSYALADKEPEISKCLEQIAISEMRHHDLIGTAIVRLGGIPYIGDNRGYWQGGYVNYTLNVKDMIDADIAGEKSAITAYKDVIKFSKNEEVKAMIARIIKDEEIHIETLESIRRSLL